MISEYMSGDHQRCDEIFARTEAAAVSGNIDPALLQGLIDAVQRHFLIEEEVLFPTFEQSTGNTAGPTQMMRMEHQQMRSLFTEMTQAANENDADELGGLCDTLLILMRQHNMKEENILYPMIDRACAEDESEILERIQKM